MSVLYTHAPNIFPCILDQKDHPQFTITQTDTKMLKIIDSIRKAPQKKQQG